METTPPAAGSTRVRTSPLRTAIERFARDESHERRQAVEAARGPEAALLAREGEVDWLPYGPSDSEAIACEILANAGPLELEYAAIRSGVGIFDANHQGTLVVRGGDRREFLQRMLTADLREFPPGRVSEAFWLNRKGRIDADLLLGEFGTQIVAAVDLHSAAAAAASLERFVVSEDVEIADASDSFHHLWLLGPKSGALLEAASGAAAPAPASPSASLRTIADTECLAISQDWVGAAGQVLVVPADRVAAVWEALLQTEVAGTRQRVRPVGWLAFNVARIESGTPLFQVDFGSEALPHETGVLARRVSFRKGCYLGQEVVARMESLGKPKQRLVGLRPRGDLLPVAGAQVFALEEGSMGPCVGQVTSSTPSPMLGAAPIAFAMVRSSHADEGTEVLVNAEGEQVVATVVPLRFVAATAGEVR